MTAAEREALRLLIDARKRALVGPLAPGHGLTGYVKRRCRCGECRAAHTAANRRWLNKRARAAA